MGILHTAMAVSDLEATKAFYETLGFEHTNDFKRPGDDVRNYFVGTGSDDELQFRYDENREEPIDPSGIDHLAIGVENVDEEVDRIVDETDCPVVTEPTTIDAVDTRVAFIEDPDGYVIELVEQD